MGYWSQTSASRPYPVQTTAKVNCRLLMQCDYSPKHTALRPKRQECSAVRTSNLAHFIVLTRCMWLEAYARRSTPTLPPVVIGF